MRKPFIAGNWKMNKTDSEAKELVSELKNKIDGIGNIDVLVCPPFTALGAALTVLQGSSIVMGAQNIYWQESGAFTGEVSAQMIKSIGCKFVIIGHSERRKYFFETNSEVNKKIKAAISASVLPIVCVGETLDEREQGKEKDVVQKQLREGLDSLSEKDLDKLTLAYEPVWAIGTGKTATGSQAEEMHAFVRSWLKETYSSQCADNLRILYGGSVKPDNIKELMSQGNIDGALVGGASLDVENFTQIIKNALSN